MAAALDVLADRLIGLDRPGEQACASARLRLFDTLVAARIGRTVPDAASLAPLAIGTQGRIRTLVATIRATEVDDIALAGCVTAGSVVIPTALVLAAEIDADAAVLHGAIVAGYEAMAGFAAAIGGASILYRGIWPTLAAAPIGAAVVAARLRRLDRAATASALAMATGRSMWWLDRAMPRWLQLGHAAVDGVLAAEAAAAKFVARADVLDGWASAAGITFDARKLIKPEGLWIDAVDCKTFPTSRQGLSAVQAFADLHAAAAVTPADKVEVAVPAAYLRMIGNTSPPDDRIGSMLSVAYQMALMVHAPDRLHDVARTPPPITPAIVDFLARVTIREDADLSAHYPEAWGARVTILSADGSRRTRELLHPEGSAAHAFGWPELRRKAALLAQGNGLTAQSFDTLSSVVEADGRPADILAVVEA